MGEEKGLEGGGKNDESGRGSANPIHRRIA